MQTVRCISVTLRGCYRGMYWQDIIEQSVTMCILYREVIVTEHLWQFVQSRKTGRLGKSVIFITKSLRNTSKGLGLAMMYIQKHLRKSIKSL